MNALDFRAAISEALDAAENEKPVEYASLQWRFVCLLKHELKSRGEVGLANRLHKILQIEEPAC